MAGGPNASYWGEIAHQLVYKEATALTPKNGNWFAGSERSLEQLIASYDVTYELFTPQEVKLGRKGKGGGY